MSASGPTTQRRRTMLVSLVLLAGIAAAVFLGIYLVDWWVSRDTLAGRGPFSLLFAFDVDTLQNTLGNMAQVVAAVLGIVITVVSIVVQLAATRYTPRIADMFFRDRTNLAVIGFFVVACIDAAWVSVSIGRAFLPRASIVATMIVVTASILIMVPYFAYVFDFLDPDRVVGRLQQQAVASALGQGPGKRDVAARQARALAGVEQLADIAVNAVSQKDRAMALHTIDAMKDLVVTYLAQKRALDDAWFVVGDELRANQDFVALAAVSVDDLAVRRVWLEWKVLRQFQAIYNEALGEMPDVNHLIAINTRYLGEAALGAGDEEAVALTVKFFNTFLRATINAEEIRTAYNILNQYRQLTERALAVGVDRVVRNVAVYFKYYGQLAHQLQLGFVTETIAYDLAALCERAFVRGAPADPSRAARASDDGRAAFGSDGGALHGELLTVLLELDKEAESVAQESSLRGVRKAQAKLAAFYLVAGAEAHARRIFDDMKDERPERLRSICQELLRIESKDFWEVVDRGTNFDYLDPAQKTQLKIFFGWFPNLATVA